MIWTIRLRHPVPIHVPRKFVRTHSDPVEWILQAKSQPKDKNADRISLQLCRAYFLTTLGIWSNIALSAIIAKVPSFTGSEFSLWERCVFSITQATDATDIAFHRSEVLASPHSSMPFSVWICRYVPSHCCISPSPTYAPYKIKKKAPTNVSGRTAEFRPRDNRHLIVHECSAFGPGELQPIRDFITNRNHKSRQASERLHAIW